MIRVAPLVALLAAGGIAGGLAGCAPGGTDAVARPYAIGAGAPVTYGTIVGLRPVTPRGVTGAGSPSGDWRSSLLAGLGGPGAATGRGAAAAAGVRAVEFLVREEGGREIATVQTNEDGLAMGERVAIIRAEGTRLARAPGGARAARPPAVAVRSTTLADGSGGTRATPPGHGPT